MSFRGSKDNEKVPLTGSAQVNEGDEEGQVEGEDDVLDDERPPELVVTLVLSEPKIVSSGLRELPDEGQGKEAQRKRVV